MCTTNDPNRRGLTGAITDPGSTASDALTVIWWSGNGLLARNTRWIDYTQLPDRHSLRSRLKSWIGRVGAQFNGDPVEDISH